MTTNNAPNRLLSEKSPYLLQHAHNPVDWYPWCDQAFEKARAEDKPVFLSSGYSACHWCHVMAHESFEDGEIARLLNENFVSVKLDREERPDIDNLCMEACVSMNGHGGWPLTVFLDHDRRPFFAGTYYPKDSFAQLLYKVSDLWKNDRSGLDRLSRLLLEHLSLAEKTGATEPGKDAAKTAFSNLNSAFDRQYAGFGVGQKFPSVPTLLFLLRYGGIEPESGASELVAKTLTAMESGGIFDHIGGGFFRYATDRRWLVPHFEKMLYDNALLIMAYSEAAVAIDPAFGQTARRCVEYILREMHDGGGVFYTSQDADSAEGEGAYYLWTPEQVTEALGAEDGEAFCAAFDITKRGNFEGKSIPNRIGREGDPIDRDFAIRSFEKLLLHRAGRSEPGKDDKIMAGLNGLMIAALACAGRYLDEPELTKTAEKAAGFVLERLVLDGRLYARYRDGDLAHPGTLEDYAFMVWGMLELYQSDFDPKWLGHALLWTEKTLELFREDNGVYLSGSDVTDLPIRQKVYTDSAMPSGAGVAAINLLRLSELCERDDYRSIAHEIITGTGGNIADSPMAYATLLSASLMEEHGARMTVTDGQGRQELVGALRGYLPFLNTILVSEYYKSGLEKLAPQAAGIKGPQGRAEAYYCDRFGCRPPISDPEKLKELLGGDAVRPADGAKAKLDLLTGESAR